MRIAPLLIAAVALAAVAAPRSALATSSGCKNAPDGAPCSTDCASDGSCLNQQCVGGKPVPDGTFCATGSFCTLADHCVAGVCTAGPQVNCGVGPCGARRCVEGLGCTEAPGCSDGGVLPDLLVVVPDGWSHDDFRDAAVPPDLVVDTPDLALYRVDLVNGGGVITGDAAEPPDFGLPTGPDLAPSAPPAPDDGGEVDLGMPDLADGGVISDLGGATDDLGLADDADVEAPPLHIHGSGCDVGGGGGSAGAGVALALVALAIGRRRRRGEALSA